MKLKVITGSGNDFENEVNEFISNNKIHHMSFTANAVNCAAFVYEPKKKTIKEDKNGTKPRKSRISSKNN